MSTYVIKHRPSGQYYTSGLISRVDDVNDAEWFSADDIPDEIGADNEVVDLADIHDD